MKSAKKRSWLKITLCVLVACGVLGTVVAGIAFLSNPGKTGVSSSVLFSFNGSANGVAPNGYAFTADGISSDEVIRKALEDTGMSEKYTVEQIREQLEVRGVYPDDIVEQMMSYDSKLDFNASRTMTLTSYFPTQYSVALYNGFDQNISQSDLQKLLESVLASYRTYFADTYALGSNETAISRYSAEDDYAQQLAVLTQDMQSSADYAGELAGRYPSMRLEGKGFGDIAKRLEALIRNDAKELSANISLNRITKNRDGLKSLYGYRINTLDAKLAQDQALLDELDVLISCYERNGDIYLATSGALTKIDSNSYETYDKLVKKRQETADRITEVNVEIEDYRTRLSDFESPDGAFAAEDGITADPQTDIDALIRKRESVMKDFSALIKAYNEQEINDDTVTVSPVKYIVPSLLSGEFAIQALKTAGPFCAVGFMVCLVLIIISRRKEEKSAPS